MPAAVPFSRILLQKSHTICNQILALGSALREDHTDTCRHQLAHVGLIGQETAFEFILLRSLSKRNLCLQNKISSRIGTNSQVCWLQAKADKSLLRFQLLDMRSTCLEISFLIKVGKYKRSIFVIISITEGISTWPLFKHVLFFKQGQRAGGAAQQ